MSDSNDIDKRVRYFNNQLLTEQDMTAEQAYHLDRERRLIREMYTPGIVSGLELALAETGKIVVKPGTAIDASGRQIVLASERTLILIGDPKADHTDQLIPFQPITGLSPQPWLLAISYSEDEDPGSTTSVGSKGNNRWLEAPAFALLQEGSPQAGIDYLVLGKLSLSISDNGVSIDPLIPEDQKKARIYAGIKLEGSLTVGGKNDSPVSMKGVPLSVRIPDPNLVVEKDGTITIPPPSPRSGLAGKVFQVKVGRI